MGNPQPDITTLDLRKEVPTGVTLVGLSTPQFDGVNFYRVPQGNKSEIKFFTTDDKFVQFEYQLYSPSKNVAGVLSIDGKIVEQSSFTAGLLKAPIEAGMFLGAGEHYINLNYKCEIDPCSNSIKQYWTRIKLIPVSKEYKDAGSGIYIKRLTPDGPNPLLNIDGVGPVRFDGANYLRPIDNATVRFEWKSESAISSVVRFYSEQPIKVQTLVNERVEKIQYGDSSEGVSVALSLANYPKLRSISFKIECRGNTSVKGCAYMYSPQVFVSISPSVGFLGYLAMILIVCCLVRFIWIWLRLDFDKKLDPRRPTTIQKNEH